MDDTLELERQEAQITRSAIEGGDLISGVVGSPIYSRRHRFADLTMRVHRNMSLQSSGLAVSRFYFNVTPPVVVDVLEHPERQRAEIDAKREYCANHGYRYVLVTSDYDDESVRKQLAPVLPPAQRGKPRTTATAKRRPPRTRKATA
jgi:hypothetical protein